MYVCIYILMDHKRQSRQRKKRCQVVLKHAGAAVRTQYL